MSLASISSFVNNFIERGLVIENGIVTSLRGRKAGLLEIGLSFNYEQGRYNLNRYLCQLDLTSGKGTVRAEREGDFTPANRSVELNIYFPFRQSGRRLQIGQEQEEGGNWQLEFDLG